MKNLFRIRKYHENMKVKDINVETNNIYELIVKNAARSGAKISTDGEGWTLDCANGDVIYVTRWES